MFGKTKVKITIKSLWGTVLFESEKAKSIKEAVIEANLREANLRWADLRGADLHGANLRWADLYGADLYGANLHGADLREANLRWADLYGADLRGADLRGANLRGADLHGADLREAKNIPESAAAQSVIVPDGDIIGWKKCKDEKENKVIVKLLIPSKAKRSNGSGRKCRAEFAKVLEIIGGKKAISLHDSVTEYKVGKTVKCDKWNEDRWEECGGGIHFFITRKEAEDF